MAKLNKLQADKQLLKENAKKPPKFNPDNKVLVTFNRQTSIDGVMYKRGDTAKIPENAAAAFKNRLVLGEAKMPKKVAPSVSMGTKKKAAKKPAAKKVTKK